MTAYRVTHKTKGTSFYVLASSMADALEIVALRIGNGTSIVEWELTTERPRFPIKEGVIVNNSGHAISTFDPSSS